MEKKAKIDVILVPFVARDDMRLKETHFDVKVPDAGTHKVCLIILLWHPYGIGG